jgi:2,5-furandicarboxylate decarboxylase 1
VGRRKMARELIDFLERLREEMPNSLLEVDEEIDSRFEITAFLRKLEERGKYPVVLFNNVKNLQGIGGNRVITNVTPDRKMIAMAIGLRAHEWKEKLTVEFGKKADKKKMRPVLIDKNEAPVKEIIKIGEKMDLREFPFIYHHEMDGNPYGTMLVITKKPDDLGYNLSYHRTMFKDSKRTGIHMSPFHTRRVFNDHEERDEPTPVIMVYGHHPGFNLAGVFMSPWPWDEYEVAGAFLEEPLRLTSSETWGSHFLVPADAEIIIEGEIQPHIREPEGPFGEWTGYYGPQRQNPVIEIKAITHRKNYIWYDTDIGHMDHPGIGWEAEIYRRVNDVLPGVVKAVYNPPSGRGGFHVYISIKKMSEGMPSIAACAAQTVGYPKLIIVVDEDIDAYNESEVLFAVATRFQGDQGLTILKDVRGSMLDPSMAELNTHSSVFINATKPYGMGFSERVKVPDEVMRKINLEKFLAKEQIADIPSPNF